ncbi:MAG: plasmid recombination protein [Clostridia bacterium]|nr:plasmid recombination protein [Clostridia bacterium]
MPLYAILRFQKRKVGGIACCDRHNERKKTEYKSNPNIDLARTHLNYHLVAPKGRYKDICTNMIDRAGCKVRSNSTLMVETLVTASPELLDRMTRTEQQRFFERAAEFLYGRIGRENVISAVVHMDEKTPHMHLCFCPITKDGRLSAKDILGNKQALSKWQDDFFAWMAQAYPALSRGIPSYITHRKHIPPYQFRMAKDLSKSYGRLEEALQTVTVFNAGKKREEALGIIGELLPASYKLAGQLHSTEDYIQELEEARKKLEAETQQQADALVERGLDQTILQAQLEEAQEQIEDLLEWQQRAREILGRVPQEMLDKLDRRTRYEQDR